MRWPHLASAWSVFAVMLLPSVSQGVGFVHNKNFVVLAPDRELAEAVLAKADGLRVQIAREWFAEELPCGAGRTVIDVEVCDKEDSGVTWAIDSSARDLHHLWLTTTRQRAVGTTLGHEMVHVVFATRFPERLPAWCEEGAASLQDDLKRIAIRRRIMAGFSETGNWPRLEAVLAARTIPTENQATYAAAVSLTEYLLSRGDKTTLVHFAQSAKVHGYDQALQQYYCIDGVGQLQSLWQSWASRSLRAQGPAAPTAAGRFPTRAGPAG